ncbi:MAG: PhzF family phenazine biosynthesis protein [Firmicutes bacterium]|nr:PhzF family phenazine biosynthesis protein [Bacillota bacterium]
MRRRLYHLDVFTTRPFTGNPLAVVIDGDGLSVARMQAIAREMNLSETVFVQKPTSSRALARLRIFTVKRELPLAGHPVIGTWHLLAELGVVPASEGAVHVWQQTGAGILPVEIEFAGGRPKRVTMTQRPARFRPARLRLQALAEALGLRTADFDPALPIELVSTGIYNLMVPLRHRTTLRRIRHNPHALQRLLRGRGTLAYCFAVGRRGRSFARGLLPWEQAEDPATGSAGGSLAAYLVRHRQWQVDKTLEITQGVEMRRPSRIEVRILAQNRRLVPLVSGSAVRIFEGHLEA